jgi:F0F1-type ATP synthase assembly protein I
MKQLTPIGLVKIMAQVTAIMVIPMVGGAVAGILIDMALETSPLFVLIGLLFGTAVSAAGIWLLIRAGTRDGEPVARSSRHDG